MRKTAILIAGAIAFDLGVLVVAGHADTVQPYKDGKASVVVSPFSTGAGGGAGKANPQEFHFTKMIDTSSPALEVCTSHGGTVTTQNGVRGCLLPGKGGPASIFDQGSQGVLTSYKH